MKSLKAKLLFFTLIFLAQLSASETTNNIDVIKQEFSQLKEKIGFFSKKIGYIKINEQNFASLYKLVLETAKELNISVPTIFIYNGNIINTLQSKLIGMDSKINAFAYTVTQRFSLIAIGSDLIENLSFKELRAVIAHELGHIKHYYSPKMIGLFIVLNSLKNLFINKIMIKLILKNMEAENTNNDLAKIDLVKYGFALNALANLSQKLILNKYARHLEIDADNISFQVTKDLNMINAINKMKEMSEEVFEKSIMGKIANLFSTHPSHSERSANLNKELEKYRKSTLQA